MGVETQAGDRRHNKEEAKPLRGRGDVGAMSDDGTKLAISLIHMRGGEGSGIRRKRGGNWGGYAKKTDSRTRR